MSDISYSYIYLSHVLHVDANTHIHILVHVYTCINLCQLYLYVHWKLHAAASKILTDEILPVNFLCMRKYFRLTISQWF